MRALWPEAAAADLEELNRRRAKILAREREALAGLWSGDTGILSPGHTFLARHPELTSGLVTTLHQGPYALVLEILLQAGLSPLVLVSAEARRVNEDRVERLVERLGYAKAVEWMPVEERGSLPKLLRGLRDGRVVVAYMDGNMGADGFGGTRDRGLPYRLPGRSIRVRTGLARMAARVGAPIHQLSVHWDETGLPAWETGVTRVPVRGDDTDVLTRRLYDWCFGQVLARPEQWSFWGMLQQAAACFGRSELDDDVPTAGLRQDYIRAYRACLSQTPRTVRLLLDHQVEVWPGDVLADLTCDRFYPAAGLADSDLEPLRQGNPTLTELTEHHGAAWVGFHGLRLCLLGMARLGG
ncbi:hypothetical protein DRQ50_12970 [bacterium]|nr:MAG: hypothetical protein DRQ50_12970 [bacterium]